MAGGAQAVHFMLQAHALLVSLDVAISPQVGPPGLGMVDRPHAQVVAAEARQLPRCIRLLEAAGWVVIDHGLYLTTWPESDASEIWK